MRTHHWLAGSLLLSLSPLAACDDDDDGLTGVGMSCSNAAQCFASLDEDVMGEAVCLDRVQSGYCTHECGRDDDCCAVEGECPNGKEQVCAPFESDDRRLCFLSCEGEDDSYCETYAFAGFVCRSTGGGSANRKVCVPNE